MRILLLLLVCAVGVDAAAMDFAGFVSSWKQDCTDGCAPPAGGTTEAASFKADVPMTPGEARIAKFEKSFSFPSGEKIRASVTVYFLCPPDAAGESGGDSCPTRYLQVQTVLSGDARAFCAAALNPADARPFPVMMCAGENLRRAGERLGISLSRKDLRTPSTP